jgi:hypothetical protein
MARVKFRGEDLTYIRDETFHYMVSRDDVENSIGDMVKMIYMNKYHPGNMVMDIDDDVVQLIYQNKWDQVRGYAKMDVVTIDKICLHVLHILAYYFHLNKEKLQKVVADRFARYTAKTLEELSKVYKND